MVTANVGCHPVQFLVDTGAELSVLKTTLGQLTNHKVPIRGLLEEPNSFL